MGGKRDIMDRWETDDYSKQKPFQCNTCKYFKGYPKCDIFGIIPSGVMKRERDCKEYKRSDLDE